MMDSTLHYGDCLEAVSYTHLRDKSTVDLLIRKRIMETEGVVRVVKLNTLFSIGSRTYSIYMQVLLRSGNILEDTLIIGLEDENGV